LKFLYPLFIFFFSLLFIFDALSALETIQVLNPFGLVVYITIAVIVMIALFILQRIAETKEIYLFFSAGLTFTYGALILTTLSKISTLYSSETYSNIEDMFRLIGIALVVVALIKWIVYNEHIQEELTDLASRDILTGVMNRRIFNSELQREIANARRYDESLSLIMIDIDHFKEINDRYGHLFGDMVLKSFTEKVLYMLREGDLLSRWGGDEFAILLPHTDGDAAMIVAQKIEATLKSSKVQLESSEFSFTVSQGVTELHEEDVDLDQIQDRCDQALYKAKRQGRNRAIYL